MHARVKRVDALTVADLEAAPVWRFASSDESSELLVRAVAELPAKDLAGCVVGTSGVLANGTTIFALLGNVDATDAFRTKHFLTVALWGRDGWLHLARYHDVDREERGPRWLAAALGLRVEEVFPIRYDLRRLCSGRADALAGTVELEPSERLSRSQLIALAVPSVEPGLQ